jgi:hypothetical protein
MKVLSLFIFLCVTSTLFGQELVNDGLQGFNLFIMPAPQINVTLSLDSNNIIDPSTGFSITPGVETIDMVAVYHETNSLQSKPYSTNRNTNFGRLRFKNDDKGLQFSLNNNDNFAREFRSSNPAFFEANRNTALHRSYNPLSCYNTSW